ncbi:TMEM175 family protein [Methanospirillum hungatei]|jgi:uncharacterized membrane protein|uniref:TMEM175 family protein n=1 Tax=Methanospirillum hungatei TaxID=2203 RepID=UPI0026EC7339|nr:TMEM175 family protein [Methanospirillum hungatei]MCA1916908.1 DUF1211 domain-containing protein [Methanospirillum hungatei]
MKRSDYYERRGLDRIIGISDAVFAFSLTLLAIDLVVPDLQKQQDALLVQGLADEYSRFLYFFLTFIITAAYWSNHHRIFRFIVGYDGILMRLNTFFLLFIIMMPFVTKLINEYGHLQIAVIIAAIGYAAPGLLLGLIWHYASKRYMHINKDLPEDFVRLTRIKNYISPGIFLLSIPLSFIRPSFALYFWLFLFPAHIIADILFPDIIEDD